MVHVLVVVEYQEQLKIKSTLNSYDYLEKTKKKD